MVNFFSFGGKQTLFIYPRELILIFESAALAKEFKG